MPAIIAPKTRFTQNVRFMIDMAKVNAAVLMFGTTGQASRENLDLLVGWFRNIVENVWGVWLDAPRNPADTIERGQVKADQKLEELRKRYAKLYLAMLNRPGPEIDDPHLDQAEREYRDALAQDVRANVEKAVYCARRSSLLNSITSYTADENVCECLNSIVMLDVDECVRQLEADLVKQAK